MAGILGFSLAAAVSAGEPPPGQVIEELIVTAQKREEPLQETPISVTAFTGRTIEDLGFRQSVDITAQTPNFTVGYPNGDTGVPAMFIRGVGLNDFAVLNQGPIASYVDEVYISSNAAQIFQLLDVERVEVLRGPQGTLYGRNATGGAVNYLSRRPGEEWEGWGRASLGNWNSTKFEGAIGGPVGERAGIRAALLKTDSDGWMKNRFTGHDQQGVDELAGRVLVAIDPSDTVDVLVNVHGGRSKSDSVQYRHLGTWPEAFWFGDNCADAAILAGDCVDVVGYSENRAFVNPIDGSTAQPVPGYSEGNYDFEAKNDTEFWGAALTLHWELGSELLLTSISAYDDVDDARPEETDASPADVLTGVLGVEQRTFSQELRLSQSRDRWNWLVGAYYLNDEADDRTSFDLLRLLRPGFVGVDDPAVCGPLVPAGNPTGFCPLQSVFEQQSATEQTIESVSLYADASFDLGEAWRLSVGLRYTDERIEHDAAFFYAEPEAGNPLITGSEEDTDFSNVSGRVVLDWKPMDDLLVYGSVSTGFKGGGIQSTTDGSFPYDEEELVSYEAGFKWTGIGGRLRFNGAAFLYDYSDLQVFQFVILGDPPTPLSLLTNASDAEILGLELELQWLPVENLLVNLGLGWLDTEYQDFVDDLGNDFTGNEITLAPELNFNGLVQYDLPLDPGTVTVQVDWSYQDDVFFDALNNPLLSQDGYWLWNGRVAWGSADDRWEVAAWVRNLGNEHYLSYAFDLSFFGFHEQMLGTPRSYGVELTYRHR
ncbi:MAG TPA: TonB-dependent receptor [Pseudomonadales bacterium]